MTKGDEKLVRELATLVVEFAIRLETQSVLTRDERVDALLNRADRALWDAYMRIEPLH